MNLENKKDNIDSIETAFNDFWFAYPNTKRKVAKKECHSYFISLINKEHEDPNNILLGLELWKQDKDWEKDYGAYIPAPLVFLHQRRWEGIISAKQSQNSNNITKELSFEERQDILKNIKNS